MEETFTMRCNRCGTDYQALRDAVYSPIQICNYCAEELRENKNENHVQ